MKKRIPSILLAIAILVLVLVLIPLTGSNPETESSSSSHQPNPAIRSDANDTAADGHRGGSPAGLLSSAKTRTSEQFSSTVDAKLKPGETLVMGGYRTPDGNHEFTILTPSLVTLEDGSKKIRVIPKTLRVDPDFAQANGMNTLTTGYPTADQHAEAWSEQELSSTLRSATQAEGARITAGPTIVVAPGKEAGIYFGDPDGPGFTIKATIQLTDEGGFSIHSRAERRSGEQP